MTSEAVQILISMLLYIAAVIGIGLWFARMANKSSENYFLGGRSLGPWVTAMSAEASDMSGWLLMGLPGVAYWCGLADAFWTAVGLAIGTYFNWLIVSKRLRRYCVIADNSITLPEFFSNRFKEKKKLVLSIAAIFILVFFTVYAASCFVTCGKLFATLFGTDYVVMMLLGALFVLIYTIIGGFLAESASDFMQSIVMIGALSIVVIMGTIHAGGFGEIFNNAKNIPGFLEFFGLATPLLEDGKQIVEGGVPAFGDSREFSILSVASALAWGLGYFGMPQVLLRFMAIKKADDLKRSRRIAMVWVVISLFVAIFIGIIGRYLFPTEHLTQSSAESIFITMSTKFLPPFIAGLVMAGILAATISSSDSYLLIAASALSKNLFQGIFKKNATDKQTMLASRIALLAITVIAALIALDEDSVIFTIVSFAWAGFGATFGPLMLFSLFWKRTTRAGAVAGMVSGATTVFIWKLLISKLGGVFAIYELLPAFIVSSIAIVIASLLTKEPDGDVIEDFKLACSNKDIEEIA